MPRSRRVVRSRCRCLYAARRSYPKKSAEAKPQPGITSTVFGTSRSRSANETWLTTNRRTRCGLFAERDCRKAITTAEPQQDLVSSCLRASVSEIQLQSGGGGAAVEGEAGEIVALRDVVEEA